MEENFEENVKLYLEGDKSKIGNKEDFYFKHLYREVLKRFLAAEESRKIAKNKYKFVISIVGFSPQPILFWHELIKPEKHFFICSPETEKTIDRVVPELQIKSSQYFKSIVNSSDILDIYKKMKDVLQQINKSDWHITLIDITGGKKSMVGAVTTIGQLLHIGLGYIDYKEYLVLQRKPRPGTEFPVILDNPLEVFGDVEIDKAKAFFNAYHFEKVADILYVLHEQIRDVRTVEKYILINDIYKMWNDFKIDESLKKIDKFILGANSRRYDVEDTLINTVENHKNLLQLVKKGINGDSDNAFYVPLNFYFAAERYAKIAKFDIAVFLMYRTLESIEQIRLRRHGIHHSNANKKEYENAGVSLIQYSDVARDIYGNSFVEPHSLPKKISLMEGYIILKILNDKVADAKPLKEILDVTALRNKSIYAHGLSPLNEEDYKKIHRIGATVLNAFLQAENKGDTFKDYEDKFKFPKLS